MNDRRLLQPLVVLALLWLAFAAYVWLTAGQLPPRVATHFGVNGEPNGWLTSASYVRFTLIFGALVPAFVVLTFHIVRRCTGWGLNIPHKDFWLAPERREETFAFVQRQGYGIAGLLIAFFAGMHWIVLGANAQASPALPLTSLLWVVVPFLGATLVWSYFFIGHFFRKSA